MNSVRERGRRIWEWLEGEPSRKLHSIAIPPERVKPAAPSAQPFREGGHYFSLRIHEMFLAQSREWWSEYEPMALAVTEFLRAGQKVTVPFVVGPQLLQDKIQKVSEGIVISDTQVAGPHLYSGGNLAFSIVLARVRRKSHAADLLGVIEQVASAFPAASSILPNLKVAGAVLQGVENLFGMEETRPLVGHRWEYNADTQTWMKPGYAALINADLAKIDSTGLTVEDSRLVAGTPEANAQLRKFDHVLYSLQSHEQRSDYQQLPFHQTFLAGLGDAGTAGDDAWKRAKASLATTYRELLLSPDVSRAQADSIFAGYRAQYLKAHTDADQFEKASTGGAAEMRSRDLSIEVPRPEGMLKPKDTRLIDEVLDLTS